MVKWIGLAIAAMIAFPTDVSAQNTLRCLKRMDMVARLGMVYEEAPRAAGITQSGGVVELLRTTDGNSWSLIMTYPTGVSCMIAAGEAWHQMPQPEKEEGPVS